MKHGQPNVPFLEAASGAPSPRRPMTTSSPPSQRVGDDLVVSRQDVGDLAVVRLEGALSARDGIQVRLALLQEFAGHERTVVCDLAGLRGLAPSAASEFAAAAAAAGGWPIVRLALARPRPAVATQLRKSGAGRFVVVESSLARAAAAAERGPRALRQATTLDPATALVEGRRFVADCCLRWRQPQLTDAGRAVAGRLLAAAASHTPDPFQLRITYEGGALTLRAMLSVATAPGVYALPEGVSLRTEGPGGPCLTAGLARDALPSVRSEAPEAFATPQDG